MTRTFDAAGRMTSVSDWLGHTFSFAFDANDNLTTETYPVSSGTAPSSQRTYTTTDQVTRIVDAAPSDATPWSKTFNSTRDPMGQVAGNNDPFTSPTYAKIYDPLERLSQITKTVGSTNYTETLPSIRVTTSRATPTPSRMSPRPSPSMWATS